MKSWKTTLTGILTIVAALSTAAINYLQHGAPPDLSVLLPALMAGVGLIHAKDDDVSHAGRPLEPAKVIVPVVAALLLPVLLPMLFLAGCDTLPTGNPTKDRRNRVANALLQIGAKSLGTFAVNTLQAVVSEQMTGAKIDFADAAAQGAWASATTVMTSADVERVINAWSGDKLPEVATAAASQYRHAVANGVAPETAMNGIASVISGTALQAK